MQNLLAEISRQFLNQNHVIRYKLKKVLEMSDEEVMQCCHYYCEENHLTEDWKAFRAEMESGYHDCDYVQGLIDKGDCYDLLMIGRGMIKPSALPELCIDRERLGNCCSECKHGW